MHDPSPLGLDTQPRELDPDVGPKSIGPRGRTQAK